MLAKLLFGCALSILFSVVVAGNSISCHEIEAAKVKQCKLTVDHSSTKPVYGIVPMPYALCSQARCQLSANKKTAKCRCDLITEQSGWKSFSLSPVPYQMAVPTFDDAKRLRSVQSNYSMANLDDFKNPANQTCQYKKPAYWANCYGVRCAITEVQANNQDRKQVFCTCPVMKSKQFMIGVRSNTACRISTTKVWSATLGDGMKAYGANPALILYKELFPNSPPVKGGVGQSVGVK